jgi:nucleoside phosphorylase
VSWSFPAALRAAAQVRAAELGPQAVATIRPRAVVGLIRSRAPLPLLLYVAARDGLVVAQDGGGFAVLQPPLIDGPNRSGGYRLRFLRWLDRRWDFMVFAAPPVLGILVSAAMIPFPAAHPAGVVILLLGMLWVAVLMTSMLVRQLGWMSRLGAPSTRTHGRAAESLPGYHWSAPLVHQLDPRRVDELMQLMTDRLRHLIVETAQRRVTGKARIKGQVTETLVVLTTGVCTERTRAAMARSLRAIRDYSDVGDVIVLAAPFRLESMPRRRSGGGSFLLLHLLALAVLIAVSALFVADTESTVCAATSCVGRPATYSSAVRWLLQRMLFSDPAGLSPLTIRVAVLGWVVSVATVMLVLVAFVAGRQEIARNRESERHHRERLADVVQRTRALILVVTDGERRAVAKAVQQRSGEPAITDQTGPRTAYLLGTLGNTELLLAQAGEQGTGTAAGMLVSAFRLIPHFRPDHVILTGICYGLRPDEGQRAGDIVIGRRVQGVDHRKVTDDGVIGRGVNVGCSPFLLDRFQAGQATWTGSARVHLGTVLTSNTVVNSRELVRQLRTEFPDAIAGEMEGTGVYEATTEDIKPDWILVKAISDWGYQKDDGGQPLAARNAAEFVAHVVASGALRRLGDAPTRRAAEPQSGQPADASHLLGSALSRPGTTSGGNHSRPRPPPDGGD